MKSHASLPAFAALASESDADQTDGPAHKRKRKGKRRRAGHAYHALDESTIASPDSLRGSPELQFPLVSRDLADERKTCSGRFEASTQDVIDAVLDSRTLRAATTDLLPSRTRSARHESQNSSEADASLRRAASPLAASVDSLKDGLARTSHPPALASLKAHPEGNNGMQPSSNGMCSPGAAKDAPKRVQFRFAEYLDSELHLNLKAPKKDDFFGQTKRDKLYNSLFSVGPQLERYMLFGFLICLDCFLGVLTLLPLRVGVAVRNMLLRRPAKAEYLYDCAVLLVVLLSAFALVNVKAGAIYYWMKDITPVFLKIHALHGALDLMDKILVSYSNDAIATIGGTCNMIFDQDKPEKRPKRWFQLSCDLACAWFFITAHGVVTMSQALIYAVALNGSPNALLALLIASQFMEVKGIVYKQFDANKLHSMALMDLTERFHLALTLMFVVAEDVASSGSFWPDKHLLWECGRIFGCEMAIDILKHASLAKFNGIRPGVYREYFRSLTDSYVDKQSHDAHTLVMFEPFGTAALALRQLYVLLLVKGAQYVADAADGDAAAPGWRLDAWLAGALPAMGLRGVPVVEGLCVHAGIVLTFGAALWALTLAFKMLLGYGLKEWALGYNAYYDVHYGSRFFKTKARDA